MRAIRYRDIAADIRSRVDEGESPRGRLLPSESELSGAYKASRVTIRKALEVLREEGLVSSRQGFGWSVAGTPVRQPLARLATLEAQLEAEGKRSQRQILGFEFVAPPDHVRNVLDVDKTLKVTRLNLADGEPFARVTVWCPEALGSELSKAQVEDRSFYELLPVELGGATQTIGADAADETDARLLAIPIGSPVLVCERITEDRSGTPVLIGQYVFAAHRTEFIVGLAHPEASIAPGGLRLVQ